MSIKSSYTIFPTYKLREIIKWVADAVSIDPGRDAMRGVLIERDGDGVRMVGTDGQRLHLSEINAQESVDLPLAGVYDVRPLPDGDYILTPKDVVYPNWRAVIREKSAYRSEAVVRLKDGAIENSMLRIYKLAGAMVQHRFVDAIACLGPWAMEYEDCQSTLVFRNGNGQTAVIMPLRKGDE
jgi:hypothetical protein